MDWATSQERRTSSLTRRAEHCKGTPIILCGFHVTELALKETNRVKGGTNDRLRLQRPCAWVTELQASRCCFSDCERTQICKMISGLLSLQPSLCPQKQQMKLSFQGGDSPFEWPGSSRPESEAQSTKQVKELPWHVSPPSLLLTLPQWPRAQSSFHWCILFFSWPSCFFFQFNWLPDFSNMSLS